MALLRRSAVLLRLIQSERSVGDMIRMTREMSKKNRKALDRMRTRQGTNPYSKEQYIDAFIQAQSVKLARSKRLEELAAQDELLLPKLNSVETDSLCEETNRTALATHKLSGSSGYASFGAWRKGPTEVERTCILMDRNLYCIVQGATTPPAFSPSALRRDLPLTIPCVRRFLSHVQSDGSGTWPSNKQRVFKRLLASCVKSACMNDAAAVLKLLGVTLQTAGEGGWRHALLVYGKSVVPCCRRLYAQQTPKERSEAMSFLVAVLCESIRSTCGLGSSCNGTTKCAYPPFETVKRLVSTSQEALLPVAAGPVFSLLGPSEPNDTGVRLSGATWRDAVQLVCYFHPERQRRTYLPPLAWAELLRAVHRMGGSLKEVQMIVDVITDPTRTKHGEEHMHDTRIWNAYLTCSDWRHALDIFSNQWKHYDVKETADTSAALMHSLLRDGEWRRALNVFHRLRQKEGQLITSTSSVLTAVVQALGQQGSWDALTSMLLDFEKFLAPLGIPHEWPLVLELRAIKNGTTADGGREMVLWEDFVNSLLEHGHGTKEVQLAVRNALISCDMRRQKKQAQKMMACETTGEFEGIQTSEELFSFMG